MVMLNSSLLLIYILICGAEDLHTRRISLPISLVFAAAGICMCVLLDRRPSEVLLAALPGAMMLALSLLTRGCIGTGDAVVTAVCALFLGFRELLGCVLLSLWLSGVAALLILAAAMFKRTAEQTGELTGPKGNRAMLPYVTFLMLPMAVHCAGILAAELNHLKV